MTDAVRVDREILMLLRNVPHRGFQSEEIANLLLFDRGQTEESLARLKGEELIVQRGSRYFLTDDHERLRWLDELFMLGLHRD